MVNDIICNIRVKNLDELKNLLRAGKMYVLPPPKKEFKERYSKCRTKDGIAKLRKDMSQIEGWFTGRWKNIENRRNEDLRRKSSIKTKGFKTVTEDLK